MIGTPTREKLPSLQNLSNRDYARWLHVGLARLLIDGAGRNSFPGAENYVTSLGAIEQDLAIIFNALDRTEQASFRSGLRIALAKSIDQPEHIAILCAPMLRLAAIISAYEVADVLPSIVVQTRRLADPDRDAICELALDVAIELSAPTRESRDALLRLITAPGFSESVAGPALIALTKADPGGFSSHLDLLSEALTRQYGPNSAPEDDAWWIEERDELLVQLVEITPAHALANAFRPHERQFAKTSDWFVYDWFCRGLTESLQAVVQEAAKKVLLLEKLYLKEVAEAGEPLAEMPPGGVSSIKCFEEDEEDEEDDIEKDLERIVTDAMGPAEPDCATEEAPEREYA